MLSCINYVKAKGMRFSIKLLESCLFVRGYGGVLFFGLVFVVVVRFGFFCLFVLGFFALEKVLYLEVRYILPMKKSCT